ncbi:hypothetical protein N658DRAFT_131094 [Parathielavia hyrcaniae]|uniref:Uncharacterized protein n=1 Tax=Parathielavia hyrcaniae TaxID=113614 RepID=A0AAN6T5Q5_9PEZI|nr:hypothetical protein N658DRAFT_131094 [Parathielavia hyrcaniae]
MRSWARSKLPSFLLQPAVAENRKHGPSSKGEPGNTVPSDGEGGTYMLGCGNSDSHTTAARPSMELIYSTDDTEKMGRQVISQNFQVEKRPANSDGALVREALTGEAAPVKI